MTYYKFHVRKQKGKYWGPYNNIPYIVYNYNQVKTMENFVKKTEKHFKGKEGSYILYNNHNQSVIRFTMSDTKMIAIKKHNSLGFKYRLFKRWDGERIQLNKRYG